MPIDPPITDIGDGGGGTPSTRPATTIITIDGVDYDIDDRRPLRLIPISLVPWERHGYPTFKFIRHSQALQTRPYPHSNEEVSVTINGIVRFKGDVVSVAPVRSDGRYALEYTCVGLKRRGDRIPVHDEQTGTNQITFNYRPDDPARILSRMGRTVGQCVLGVLEMATNRQRLTAAGIGNRTSGGSGASGTATINHDGEVASAAVTAGGSGYGSTPPSVVLSGGRYATQAVMTANLTGGAVSSFSGLPDGSGYQATPSVIISTLPAKTLQDIAKLTIIPPFPVVFSGNMLLEAIESAVQAVYPTWFLHVEPDGTIRFLDTRSWRNGAKITVTDGTGKGAVLVPIFDADGTLGLVVVEDGGRNYSGSVSAAISGGEPSSAATLGAITRVNGIITEVAITDAGEGYNGHRIADVTLGMNPIDPPEVGIDWSHCYTRVEVRGRPFIEGVEVSLRDGTLEEYFGHDGLTNAEAKEGWTYSDYDMAVLTNGNAAGAAVLETAGIDSSFTITNAGTGGTTGSGYAITFSGGGGTGAAGTYSISGGGITSLARTAAGSGYSTPPTMSFTNGGVVGAAATCSLPARGVASITVVRGGYGYSSAPAVVIAGDGTDAEFTASVSGGAVTSFSQVDAGSGYTEPPAVLIGNPSGAAPAIDYFATTADWRAGSEGSTLVVHITSLDPTRTWDENFYDQTEFGRSGVAYFRTTANLVTSLETRRIVANTALTAGGECTLTLESPLSTLDAQGGSIQAYSGGNRLVWRRYRPVKSAIRDALTNEPFSFPQVFGYCDGLGEQLVSMPVGEVLWSSNGGDPLQSTRATFIVDPSSGTITFDKPTVRHYGTIARLAQGGDLTVADGVPVDVRCLVGVYKDSLSSVWPADDDEDPVYEGTAHDDEGVAETLVIQMDDWRDPAQAPHVLEYAKKQHESISDTAVETDISWNGAFTSAMEPGMCVNVIGYNGSSFDTGLESLDLPVMAFEFTWPSGGSVNWHATMRLSSRHDPYTATPLLPPPRTGIPMDGGGPGYFNMATGEGVQAAGYATPVESINPMATAMSGASYRPSPGSYAPTFDTQSQSIMAAPGLMGSTVPLFADQTQFSTGAHGTGPAMASWNLPTGEKWSPQGPGGLVPDRQPTQRSVDRQLGPKEGIGRFANMGGFDVGPDKPTPMPVTNRPVSAFADQPDIGAFAGMPPRAQVEKDRSSDALAKKWERENKRDADLAAMRERNAANPSKSWAEKTAAVPQTLEQRRARNAQYGPGGGVMHTGARLTFGPDGQPIPYEEDEP